jgi:hypothetical protein
MYFLISSFLFLSCYCSISLNQSIAGNDSKLALILALGDSVLSSDPFSFKLAKIYVEKTNKVVSKDTLTKEDLRVMELQTELILAVLELSDIPKSSFVFVYAYRKWKLRNVLKEVIDDLQFQMRFAKDSSCSSLVALNSMVNQELVDYRVLNRNYRSAIKKLVVHLEQFKKALSLCEKNSAMSMKDEKTSLLYLFTAGYALLEADSLSSDHIKKYLELLNKNLFIPENNYTKQEIETVRVQAQKILRLLQMESFTEFKTELEIVVEILKRISVSKESLPSNQLSVSVIIMGDLQIQRTFNDWKQILPLKRSLKPFVNI